MGYKNPEDKKAYHRAWYARNKEKVTAQRKLAYDPEARKSTCRRYSLKNQFGITPEQYEEMFVRQGGVCAITGRKPGRRRLAVDHDHKTGRIRGLLYHSINSAMGHFGDDPELLEAAARYLRRAMEDK
jgi:hypothetical protein